MSAAGRLARVAVPPFGRAALLVHGSALLLLGLVVSVERAASRGGGGAFEEVVVLWARLAAALGILASALAWSQMRATRLALGTLGCAEGRVRWAGLPAGLVVGMVVLVAPAQGAPAAWIRGEGGWFHLGSVIPDVPGGAVAAQPSALPWAAAAAACVGAYLGARTWGPGQLAVVVVGGLLAEGVHVGAGLPVLAAATLWRTASS